MPSSSSSPGRACATLISSSAATSTRNSLADSRSSSPSSVGPLEVGDDDLGDRHLDQLDLVAQDEREQQVERPLEHVEIEIELSRGSRSSGF